MSLYIIQKYCTSHPLTSFQNQVLWHLNYGCSTETVFLQMDRKKIQGVHWIFYISTSLLTWKNNILRTNLKPAVCFKAVWIACACSRPVLKPSECHPVPNKRLAAHLEQYRTCAVDTGPVRPRDALDHVKVTIRAVSDPRQKYLQAALCENLFACTCAQPSRISAVRLD